MLDEVKKALRINGTAFDVEIQALIDTALEDLKVTGIDTDTANVRVDQAVILFCKTHFGYDNPEADRFAASYDLLKSHMAVIANE